jgi:hypothetical protein
MAHEMTVNNLTMRRLYIMKDTLQSSIAYTNVCRTYNNVNMHWRAHGWCRVCKRTTCGSVTLRPGVCYRNNFLTKHF